MSKQKRQELYEKAIKARKQIDILFDTRKVSQEEFQKIEDELKILREFARANLRYKEAFAYAEDARSILDKALESPHTPETK
jgi:uncharacterized coiled-coil DUF342 family protein